MFHGSVFKPSHIVLTDHHFNHESTPDSYLFIKNELIFLFGENMLDAMSIIYFCIYIYLNWMGQAQIQIIKYTIIYKNTY